MPTVMQKLRELWNGLRHMQDEFHGEFWVRTLADGSKMVYRVGTRVSSDTQSMVESYGSTWYVTALQTKVLLILEPCRGSRHYSSSKRNIASFPESQAATKPFAKQGHLSNWWVLRSIISTYLSSYNMGARINIVWFNAVHFREIVMVITEENPKIQKTLKQRKICASSFSCRNQK